MSEFITNSLNIQTKESIYGHFLICYLSLLLLRLLEFKVFENKLNSSEIANGFIKNEYNLNITNAKAERMNRTIGDILRNAFGYKSFDRLRKRVLYIEREKSKK